jgi:hypothetical protein
MTMRTLQLCFLVFAIVFTGTAKADNDDAKKKKSGNKKAQQAEAIFDKIKSLAGDWVATKGEHKGQVALNVRVIAGGSAVVETEFPGSPQEMITVYHLNGNNVMLNHYCMLGNQPRMKVKQGDTDDTLVFEFASATNLASKDDAHMHEGKMKFVDQDTIHSSWVMFKDNKAQEEHTFEMARKK